MRAVSWNGGGQPDGTVHGVVGRLWTASAVAQPGQRSVCVRGAREFETQRLERIGEPAVVGRGDVEGVGALGQQRG